MALIKCSECGRQVSDKAITCPNCGAPIEGNTNIFQSPNYYSAKPKKKNPLIGVVIALSVSIILIWSIVLIFYIVNKYKETIETPQDNSLAEETIETPQGNSLAEETIETPQGNSLTEETIETPQGNSLTEETIETPQGNSLTEETIEMTEGNSGVPDFGKFANVDCLKPGENIINDMLREELKKIADECNMVFKDYGYDNAQISQTDIDNYCRLLEAEGYSLYQSENMFLTYIKGTVGVFLYGTDVNNEPVGIFKVIILYASDDYIQEPFNAILNDGGWEND